MKTLLIVPTSAIFLAMALFLGAVINAHAGHHGCMMFSADISDMDTNNDGSISASEWETFLKMHGVGKVYNKNQQG